MNITFNNSFIPYLTKLKCLEMFGMSWMVNCLFLLLVSPFNLVGIVLNIISFLILCNKKFKKNELYSYLRVNVLNSLLINILELFISLPHTYMLSDFANSPLNSFYFCYIYSPLCNFAVLYGSLMDIRISIERIAQFTPKIEILHKKQPFFVSMLLFVISMLISIQFIFQFEPLVMTVKIDPNTEYVINIWKFSDFGKSRIGSIITYLTYAFRDVFILAIEIGMNILMAILFKNYLSKKSTLQNPTNSNIINNRSISRSNRNATVMVILMSSLSVLQHIFFLIMTTYFVFYIDETGFFIGIDHNFVLSLKHFSNFVFLIIFNKEFRCVIKKYFYFRILEFF